MFDFHIVFRGRIEDVNDVPKETLSDAIKLVTESFKQDAVSGLVLEGISISVDERPPMPNTTGRK